MNKDLTIAKKLFYIKSKISDQGSIKKTPFTVRQKTFKKL